MRGEGLEFPVKKQQNERPGKYSPQEEDLAREFAKRLIRETKGFLKAVVLFGSVARKQQGSGDIDVLVVIDDLTLRVTKPLVEGYRLIVKNLVQEVSAKLHVTTLRYTSFWEYARAGDPVAVNILRDGIPLLDTGFFEPLQRLLQTGRMRPSAEAIWTYYGRAPMAVNNAKGHLLQAGVDLYWAVIDASHAALMKLGEIPPSPEHVPDLLEEKLVKPGLLDKKYAGIAREFYHLSRNILHRELKELSGEQYDHYLTLANEYIGVMRALVEKR